MDVDSQAATIDVRVPVVLSVTETASIAPTAVKNQKQGSSRGAVAARGGAWSLLGYVSTQSFRTLATIVLARRFLGPELFGLVGLVAVFIAGLSMFSELGILANVVQHPKGDEPDFLNTAFSVQAARGLSIWIVSAIFAYPLASFYHQPQIVPLLVVCGLAEFARGLTSTAAWTLTRHVKLRNITLLSIISEIIAAVVAIGWAMVSPSAWALVARTLTAAVIYAVGSHFIAEPRVHFGWDKAAARDILHFGGWISISTAAYFLGGQGERLILGKFVTPAELGCFSLALMICTLPAAGVSQLVGQIFLPMISETVRTSRVSTIRDFRRARPLFFAIGLIAALGFMTLGKPVVNHLLNSKYAMTGWMLQLLGIRVAFDMFSAPVSNLVLAYGKTKYSAAGNTTRLVAMVIGIWVSFALFGTREAILSLVVAQAVSYFPLLAGVKKLLPEVADDELRWYTGLIAIILCVAILIHAGR